MKHMRKLIPSILMVLTSLVMCITSTYAWFSMNSTVKALGMEIQAKSDDGILISNAEDGTYSNQTNVTNNSATLRPTTTADFENWYTAKSKKATDGMDLTAEGYVEIDGTTLQYSNYFLKNEVWLKSSTTDASLDVVIDSINIENVDTSAKIDACLRVAFIIGDDTFVYAPISNADSDSAKGHEATWTVITDPTTDSAITTKITSTPTKVDIYCYFEGEDKSCRSENITTALDKVKVSVDFSVVE